MFTLLFICWPQLLFTQNNHSYVLEAAQHKHVSGLSLFFLSFFFFYGCGISVPLCRSSDDYTLDHFIHADKGAGAPRFRV